MIHRQQGYLLLFVFNKDSRLKINVMSMKAKQRSVEAASNPLNFLSFYQRGVTSKYLKEHHEALQKKAEQHEQDAPNLACQPGHVAFQGSDRKETLIMLKESYADLVQKLNMMPIRTDILKMRNRKMELEKILDKTEKGTEMFSTPEIFVKIGT
jgi:hypothetical protein